MASNLPAVPGNFHQRSNPRLPNHHHHPPPPNPNAWSHRHYAAFHPTANKLLSKRWEEHARQLHLRKLKEARPTIDNGAPKVYRHLEMRLKRLQNEQERLNEIERNNHILLDRIAFQMINPSQVSDLDHAKHIMGAPQDHEYPSQPHPLPPGVGSLHGPKRKRVLKEIELQNQTILQRIEDKSPYYNRLEWLQDRCRNLEYLRNIAQYPDTYHRLLEDHEGALSKSGIKARSYSRIEGGPSPSGMAPVSRARTAGTTRSVMHETSLVPRRSMEVLLPPPGENLPIGRPPTRPNNMTGPLSDLESDAEGSVVEHSGPYEKKEDTEGSISEQVEQWGKKGGAEPDSDTNEEASKDSDAKNEEKNSGEKDLGDNASEPPKDKEAYPRDVQRQSSLADLPPSGRTTPSMKEPLPPITPKQGISPAGSRRASRPGTATRG